MRSVLRFYRAEEHSVARRRRIHVGTRRPSVPAAGPHPGCAGSRRAEPLHDIVAAQRAGLAHGAAFTLPPEAEVHRAAARDAISTLQRLPRERRREFLVSSGYLVPHWRKPWARGGRNRAAGHRRRVQHDRRADDGITGWVMLTISEAGSEEQRQRWIGPVLRGEDSGASCSPSRVPARTLPRSGHRPSGWQAAGRSPAEGVDQPRRTMPVGSGHCAYRPRRPKHAGVTMMAIDLSGPG